MAGRPILRWEIQPGTRIWYAWRGQLHAGSVGMRDDGSVWYVADAIHTRWLSRGRGEVKSVQSGKRAIDRCWQKFLAAAELSPNPDMAD